MWGCNRFPDCKGAINIAPPTAAPATPNAPKLHAPGEYAQARHERELERNRLKRRAALPLFVGVSVLAMSLAFFSMQGLGILLASLGAVAVGLGLIVAFFRMPVDSLIWTRGVLGERKTASHLEGAIAANYIVLFNRFVPGLSGDVDALVFGKTGVFAIETKNWSGKVEVRNNRLLVGESDRTWAIDDLYRETIAVQIALADVLNQQRVTVTPILCAVGGVASSRASASGVHVTNGNDLSKFILAAPVVFDDATVRQLVDLAEHRLRQQYTWEV
jgi:hypothetical protein